MKGKSTKGTWHRVKSDAKFKENWNKIFKKKNPDKEKNAER